MKLKELPDQVSNAIIALVPDTTKAIMSTLDWEELYNRPLERIKDNAIRNNGGKDSFSVFNATDGFFASQDTFTFDEAIEFVTDFHKRYDFQGGMYSSNEGRILATNVDLRLMFFDEDE